MLRGFATGLLGSILALAGSGSPLSSGEAESPARDVWSPFVPITSPRPPRVADPEWSRNPIDAFIYSRLQREGLQPALAVGRQVWLRRVTFDLTGLPPTPAEVKAFLADSRDDADAFASVVDRLLASPRYGERWARHWLDVVRYADSDGFAIDKERPTLWRYRDYVVRAFNDDLPFDRFVREQLAGDELDRGPEGVVATGFYRLGPWEADNMVKEVKRQDYLNEITTAVGAAFLGLTLGCARCHDHKYDPISMKDFYGLQAFFTPLVRDDRPAPFTSRELSGALRREKTAVDAELSRLRGDLEMLRAYLRRRLAAKRQVDPSAISDKELDEALARGAFSAEEKKRHEALQKSVESHEDAARYAAVACAVKNPEGTGAVARTRILTGGDLTRPGPEVEPCFLAAVKPWKAAVFETLPRAGTAAAGRRRLLAEWIASAENPLTARVIVNRLWQHHMGAGIVATANDLGRNGSGASHPALLDYLARELIRGGWKLKALHRLMVLSRTYRASTQHPDFAACERADPDNRLLWRGPFRRLEAEALRDAMLAVSGRLLLTSGGPGFFAALPDELGRSFPFFDWIPSAADQRRRRSLFMFQRRNLVVPMLEAFDAADMSESCEGRQRSVTAPQAFTLFNGKFAHEVSAHLARRILAEAGLDPRRQVEAAFWLAYSRGPREHEIARCEDFLRRQRERYLETADRARGKEPLVAAEIAGLEDLCLTLINSNEFLYLE